MKKITLIIAAIALFSYGAKAQNITAQDVSLEYRITEILSLGGTYVNGIGGGVQKIDAGKVGDKITVNTRTKMMKIATNRILYSIEGQKTDKFPETYLIKGSGVIPGDGGEVKFQIIDSFGEGTVNIIISWPDYSSTRFIAKLEKRREL